MTTGLVATAWTSAGDTSPLHTPATSPVPIEQRVAAAATVGYCGMGLIADDLVAVRDSIGFARLAGLFDAYGIVHIEIELLERWWIPRNEPGHSFDVRDLLLSAADVLAPSFIKIGSENGSPDGDLSALVDPLRRLADQAVEHGTRIAIEPMPFSRIASVPMGAELVSAAAHPAVGLVVDAWHVFRAGTTLDELSAAVPPGMVFGVELDDAASEVFGTLFEDTVERRLLCGEGSFDLPELVDTLRDIGFTGPWGVEILSGSFRRLPVDRALQLAADSARSVL